ncbi:hypothetical protein E3O53_10910 [Cryobacterium sp. TMT2-18-3]|uniref:hypothetical protein n=1 Tax=unclassified Cryobacterium TaxID=2649013 RepID=UPI00106A0DD2|nr:MULTISPECIES: hypothetical protein [unclassified Cryobacterium]TFC30946.1 hypothetical protein E3O22_03480 [Cryobacterium sp. TMT2-18-2]TFC34387.1 hypothetical protein E3O18_12305 [Cryobacterium sp. TMT2-42-4]TFC63349.1 hypothetical protein E3O53_10910 [Cryobacterium sp. TMT2-18-3]
MEPSRFLLEGSSLQQLKARILAEHGADARIVAAERVTVGGIKGFFARRHIEVTVEVPQRRRRAAHSRLDVQARLGIAALLDDADAVEAGLHRAAAPVSSPPLSTATDGFARLMDELTFATQEPHPPVPPIPAPAAAQEGGRRRDARLRESEQASAEAAVPRPLPGVGNLVLVVGWRDAALRIARELAVAHGSAEVLVAGTIDVGAPAAAGLARILDRRTALEARARGVKLGQTGILAFGLGADPATADNYAALVAALGAEQVWLVVDAGRKPADTARWAAEVAQSVHVDAIAVTGYDDTVSPETVDELHIPIGWVDGTPAAASTVAGMRRRLAGRPDRSS